MDKLNKYFDDFTLHARVMPGITVIIPVIILVLYKGSVWYKGSVCNNILDIPIYSTISIILIVFLSKIARERGKNYEEKMYKKLGEMPTTIIMRYSDSRIDEVTKTRYHERLGNMIGHNLPMNYAEEHEDSDSLYKSGMTVLRNFANSNRETEARVYQELKSYNYWRNLYGCKWISIGLYILVALREILLIPNFDIKKMVMEFPKEYMAVMIILLSILIMLFFVNKKVVERKAFDYAKTLAEVCERIS